MPRPIEHKASSNIKGIEYDDDARVLYVAFKAGRYEYYDVSPEIADGFSTYPSAGQYFEAFIKGKYGFRKIG